MKNISERQAKDRRAAAILSFYISLIPLSSLVIFAIHLAIVNIRGTSFESALSFLGLILLMIYLGLTIYIGSYIISIGSLICGIRGIKSEKKKFAIIGIIISIFNFSLPFLVSPVNELFLK